VGESEVHAETALFDTPEPQPGGGLLGERELAAKAVVGASHTFAIGRGLTLLGEYHYSGFGIRDAEDTFRRLADPRFQERFLRGDTQILGRHALGVQASYSFTNTWSGSMTLLGSPHDGSGVSSPSLRWDATESMSIIGTGFLPWGAGPENGVLHSEYGGRPASLFLQLNYYF
jgi:hypothetical protein